jgi:hypothetical protein
MGPSSLWGLGNRLSCLRVEPGRALTLFFIFLIRVSEWYELGIAHILSLEVDVSII